MTSPVPIGCRRLWAVAACLLGSLSFVPASHAELIKIGAPIPITGPYGVSATDAATIPRPQTPYSTPAFLLMLPRRWGRIVQWGQVVVAARLLFVWSDWQQSS